MGSVTHITDSEFADFTKQDGIVLVDFWAPWCGPCKRIAPILDAIAAERDDVRIAKLNTDENQATAMAQGIMSIPTLQIYKNGEPVDSIIGALPKESLEMAINKHV